MNTLAQLVEQLRALDGTATRGGVSQHYIELIQGGSEFTIGANREGLVWLALQCLELAERGFAGAHCHVDEVSMADRVDEPLVIAYRDAPWDPESAERAA